MHALRFGLVASALALAANLPAQLQFMELGGRLPPDTDSTRALTLGDVDGDGDTDLIFGNQGVPPCCITNDVLRPSRLYLNDGTGTFTDVTAARMPLRQAFAWDAGLGDVDGDGDNDLVLGGVGQSLLYLNDGTGTFTDVTAARMPIDSGITSAIVMLDVEADGDLDVVLGNRRLQNQLFINDGTGTFQDGTGSRMPDDNDVTYAVRHGDVDGDGDPDLVFGNAGQNQLYLNDGNGTYSDVTTTHLPRVGDVTLAVVVGDVDGDGDVDLVFGNWLQSRLYLNDGTGTFADATATNLPTGANVETRAVALGDVDGDGDLDLAFGNNAQNGIFLNDGAGSFTDVTASRLPASSEMTGAVALEDVDGDGDPEMIFANWARRVAGEPNHMYTNLLRQLDTPRPTLFGGTYQLDVYARYGVAGAGDFAYPLVAAGSANVPLPPFGTLFLDPSSLVALPQLPLPQPAGSNSVSIPVPNLPSLIGTTLFAQALVVQLPTLARLTNSTADVIR